MGGRPAIGKRGLIVLVLMMLSACGGIQSSHKGRWIADPESRSVDNQLLNARIEPQKRGNPFFVSFLLTIENKSDKDLVVDWNGSRYLFNGKAQGLLVFQGIDPEAVKNKTILPERIGPGDRLVRELMPMRLIAWTPIKDKSNATRGISPGVLPAGENGIRLALRHANSRVALPLTVRISRETTP